MSANNTNAAPHQRIHVFMSSTLDKLNYSSGWILTGSTGMNGQFRAANGQLSIVDLGSRTC